MSRQQHITHASGAGPAMVHKQILFSQHMQAACLSTVSTALSPPIQQARELPPASDPMTHTTSSLCWTPVHHHRQYRKSLNQLEPRHTSPHNGYRTHHLLLNCYHTPGNTLSTSSDYASLHLNGWHGWMTAKPFIQGAPGSSLFF